MENRRTEVDSRYSWLVAICGMYLWFIGMSQLTSFGVYYLEFMDKFRTSEIVTSSINAFGLLALCLMGPYAALAVDTYGFRVIASIACCLLSLGRLFCYMAENVSLMFAAYICQGIGSSLAVTAATLATQRYFVKWRALGTAVAGLGGSISALVNPMLSRTLIDTYGLKSHFLIFAGLCLQGLPFSFMIRPLPIPKRVSSLDTTKKKCCVFCCYKLGEFMKMVYHFYLLKDIRVSVYYIGLSAAHIFTTVLATFIVARAISLGETEFNAVIPMTVFGAANLVGRPFMNYLADKTSRMGMLSVCSFIAGTAMIISSFYYTFTFYCVCIGFFGVAAGGYTMLLLTAIIDIVGIEHVSKLASVGSLISGASSLSALLFAGWFLRKNANYALLFLLMGVIEIFAGIIFTSLAIYMCYKNGRERKETAVEQNEDFQMSPD